MKAHHRILGWLILPLLCLLQACGGVEDVRLELSLSEPEVTCDAGSVFARVLSETSWELEIVPPVDWASLQTTSGSGSKNSIILSYSANRASEARSLTVVATAAGGKATASATLRQRAYVEPAPSGAQGGRAASAPYRWLELPATSAADGMDFLWHMVDVNGKAVRNYSCYWNYSDRVSMWVAYPLCGLYLGSLSRSDAWGFDPFLPAASQQNVGGGYWDGNNGHYDRGHQLPSADRTANYAMNAATFYGTNMTPQKNSFNAGLWASLESKVRDWSRSSDTLYVVTGCVLDGAKYYALDRASNKITAPAAYYKAVLRYAPSSSTGLGHAGYMGCAVWMEHKETASSAKMDKTYSMSIDALEQKLGIDLFVNLPDKVGKSVADQIEAEDPQKISWWW